MRALILGSLAALFLSASARAAEPVSLALQINEQAQLTHKLDGRLQSLPQIISAEVRAALANPR